MIKEGPSKFIDLDVNINLSEKQKKILEDARLIINKMNEEERKEFIEWIIKSMSIMNW